MLLDAYRAFMDVKDMTASDKELCKTAMRAGSFGAAAYERGMTGGNDVHALTMAFLQALVDPAHESLDYLRADPASGQVERDKAARAIAEGQDT